MAKSSKAITKSCPACSKHVAVACKNCPCGHIFFVARRSSAMMSKTKEEEKAPRVPAVPSSPAESSSTVRFRRTERVKRDKPDFYNASEYDKQRKPKSRQRLATSEDHDDLIGEDEPKRGRGRRRKKRNLAGDLIDDKKIEDDETPPILSAQKQIQMSINLSEINRKLYTVNPVF